MQDLAEHLIFKGLAHSTRKTYESKARRWPIFCALFGFPQQPATESSLVAYVAYRHATDEIYMDGISSEISAILSADIDKGHKPNRNDWPLLGRVLKGVGRVHGKSHRSTPKKPITMGILKRFLRNIPRTCTDGRLLRLAMLIGHGALLRPGELGVSSQKHYDKVRVLRWRDLTFCPSRSSCEVLKIEIHGSKTNQFGKKEILALGCKCSKGDPCSVHEMLSLLKMGTFSSTSEPIFRMSSGNILSKRMISNAIKNCCLKENLNPAEYSPHSLRKGGATDLARDGVPEWMIQKIGRWSELCKTNRRYQLLTRSDIVRMLNKS